MAVDVVEHGDEVTYTIQEIPIEMTYLHTAPCLSVHTMNSNQLIGFNWHSIYLM